MPGQPAIWTPLNVVVSGSLLLGLGAFAAGRPAADRPEEPARVLGERLVGTGDDGRGQGGAKPPKEEDKKAFAISGGVSGLFPGTTRPLVLTLSHANNFPIRVTALSVAVGGAGPGCPSSNLSVSPYGGAVTVPANGSATTSLDVTLSASAPDACRAGTWALTYSGTAVKP